MFGTATDGKVRTGSSRRGRAAARTIRTKAVVAATSAAAAASVGFVGAPVASAADPSAVTINVTQDPTFTAGLLAGLLDQFGPDVLTIPLNIEIPNVPIVGTIVIGDLNLVLDNVAANAPSIYNAINGYNGWSSGSTRYRFPLTVGIGDGAYDLVNAYRAQLASVQGDTEQGLSPFVPGPDGSVNFTSQALVLVNNAYRPNGGILSRFAAPLNLFGVETSMPAAGKSSSTSGKITLNTATMDIAWAYSPLADFPVTLNPFSIVNSLFAAVPANLLGGIQEVAGLDVTNAGLNIAGALGILYKMSGGLVPVSDGQAWYGTLVPNELPILEPLRLPAQIINLIAGQQVVGTPLADALEPALKILVNIGYSDVVTPTDGGTYNRTFTTSATPEAFLSVDPLTPQEWAQVPGDVFRALVAGFQDAFPILRFGQPAPVLAVADDHLEVTYPTAPASVAAAVAQTDTAEAASALDAASVSGAAEVPTPEGERNVAGRAGVRVKAAPTKAETPSQDPDNGRGDGAHNRTARINRVAS